MQPPTSSTRGLDRLFLRLVTLQVARPFWFLALAVALTVPALLTARQLELHTGLESLLPEDRPSVRELHRAAQRTAGASTLSIVVRGNDQKALERFGDALLVELRALGPEWVGTAEDGVQAEQQFMRARAPLFLPLEKVKELRDKIQARFDFEIHGSLTGDAPDPIDRASIDKLLGRAQKAAPTVSMPSFPDGYYLDAAGKTLVVLVRTPIESGRDDAVATLRAKVEGAITRVNPARFDPTITHAFTGDVVTSAEQYAAVKHDLLDVGVLGIAMILLVDFLFFLRLRAVLSMALAIGIGVVWTFALTRLVLGHLNTASGFLVSIVFGNGLNYGVLLRARYNEARRAGCDLGAALERATLDTWRPTLTAATAGGAGYLSLACTTFRGFRDFGAIGAYGMLLCWLASFLFLAPLLVVFERAWPSKYGERGRGLGRWLARVRDTGVPFGAPIARLVTFAPLLLLVGGVAMGGVAVARARAYVLADPIEYDTQNLGNREIRNTSAAALLSEEVDGIVGRSGQDGMTIVVDKLDQVRPLAAALEARRRAAPASERPFERVVTIYDLIPDAQQEKLALMRDVRSTVERLRARGRISDDDWKTIDASLPPADSRPFDVDELPERVARPFTERDGTRGRIVYIVPTDGASVRDVHYLLRWADSYRATTLPSGETIYGSGRAVIFADMLSAVIAEAPRAIAFSFVGVVLVVLIAFSRGKWGIRSAVAAVASLVLGIAWMGASLAASSMKLNFLNFIALPITFGIGVEYAVNVVHRWRIDSGLPSEDARAADHRVA
ncbi:MAG: RND family transporter, partial [Polyangiales bacterium]